MWFQDLRFKASGFRIQGTTGETGSPSTIMTIDVFFLGGSEH